jgi:hypothetical protein
MDICGEMYSAAHARIGGKETWLESNNPDIRLNPSFYRMFPWLTSQ